MCTYTLDELNETPGDIVLASYCLVGYVPRLRCPVDEQSMNRTPKSWWHACQQMPRARHLLTMRFFGCYLGISDLGSQAQSPMIAIKKSRLSHPGSVTWAQSLQARRQDCNQRNALSTGALLGLAWRMAMKPLCTRNHRSRITVRSKSLLAIAV